jgi:hypothetical protein
MTPLLIGLLAQAAVQAAPAPGVPVLPAPAAKADFSGVWLLDSYRSATLLAGGRIDRGPLVVTNTGETFTVTPATAGQSPVAYAVVTSAAQRQAGGAAYWEGPALITEVEGLVNGKSVVVKQSRTLSDDGAEMIVDTILAIQHGYAPGEPLPKSTARDIYVRAQR